MTVHTTTAPVTRGQHRWLYIGAAALATGAVAATLALTGGDNSGPGIVPKATAPVAVSSIMSLTPAQLAAGALGTGYALPVATSGPTVESVLASMSPETRSYTEAITSLTFAQLAAGAAGAP